MTALDRPPVGAPPGVPASCAPLLREVDRLQWWLADGGDPAALLEDFLAAHGFAVGDLAAPPRPAAGGHRLYGAAVLVSAAAGARMIGAATARQSPAPAVPDVVAVVYHHRTRPDPADPPPTGWPVGDWRVGDWRAGWTPAEHAAAVERVRAAIARGDVYQVNLVGHAVAPYLGDPLPPLARVAALPGARHGGVLCGPGWAVGSASPETLVAVADGVVRTRPIKGTRPATDDGRAQLLASAKERAEHFMIVDLARNDLSHLARTGTVRVPRLYGIERWCGLWQAESVVAADLEPGVGLAAVLRAICPGGSVTGAPKLAALDVIDRLEPVGRGPSMGALGWIGPDRVDLGLSIRTVAADGHRLHVWAGGGITWDSEPGAEVAEAAAKAGPLRAALAG
jgi:para-aminobenzoate synthetase component 1